MTISLSVMSVPVNDQDRALSFYTQMLGFTLKHDIALGAHRWLTVVGPGAPDGVELLLEPDEHPAAKTYKAALVADGIPIALFAVDDVAAAHRDLAARGVEFTQAPTDMGTVITAVLADTCGNLIQEADEVDARWTKRLLRPRGAYVMGRNMFGPVRGPWSTHEGQWRGWWGQEPPYHAPVFVLTHHAHDPIEMEGTTFSFVTDGFDAALAMARQAGDGDVDIAGGASTVRQALAAGQLDELTLDIAPVLLGSGERIFDETTIVDLGPVEAEHSAWATHLRYRITDRSPRRDVVRAAQAPPRAVSRKAGANQ